MDMRDFRLHQLLHYFELHQRKRDAQLISRGNWAFVFTLFLFVAGGIGYDINPPKLVKLICVTAYLLPPLIYFKWG